MEDYRMNLQTATAAHRRARRALIVWGLWLRAALVGVAALIAGPMLAFTGDIRPLSALALVIGGGLLAALSWSRLRTHLDGADAPDADAARARPRAGDRVGRAGPALGGTAVASYE
jgi:hypothetical protein